MNSSRLEFLNADNDRNMWPHFQVALEMKVAELSEILATIMSRLREFNQSSLVFKSGVK
jgi:hypothetical protein